MSIANNLSVIKEKINNAADKACVNSDDIKLIAVTKTIDADKILEAIDCGVTDIGENYVQDAASKQSIIGEKVNWHLIGHLQSNKVKRAISIFDAIQSVDSISLAKEIGKRSVESGKITEVLVEVNISGESSKKGVSPNDALDVCDLAANIDGILLCGLMGIAPFTDDETEIRKSFINLREIWSRLPAEQAKWLSMGMTSDFEIAIEEGSNMVRIGTAIFGARK